MSTPPPYELVAPFYDADYDFFRTPSGEVASSVEGARRSGGPILEIACGTGRVLLPTARAGIEIAGVDLSRPMLDRLRAKLGAEPEAVRARVSLHEADACTADLGRSFSLVTIPFRSIGHLQEVERQVALYRNARRHLAKGGRLVFDFFLPRLDRLASPQPEKLEIERREGNRRIRRFASTVPHAASQLVDVSFRWEVESDAGKIEEVRAS